MTTLPDTSKAPGRTKGLRRLPRMVHAMWIAFVLSRLRGERALAALNDTAASRRCSTCGRPWQEHFGEGSCPWWK